MADWIGVDVDEPNWLVSDLPKLIAQRIRVNPDTGCWIYGKGIPSHYGTITRDGRQRQAHRVVYELLVGPIPDGLVLDHVKARGCLGYRCVWPAHLEAVTVGENSRRGRVKPAPDPEPPMVVIPGGNWPAWRLPTIEALWEILP